MAISRRVKVNMAGFTYESWSREVAEMLSNWYNIDMNSLQTFEAKKTWRSGVDPEEAVKIAVGVMPSAWDIMPDIESYFTDDYVEDSDQTR